MGAPVKHELVNGTLTREDDGIMARCTCGWSTRGRFSSFAASASFQEHQEQADKPKSSIDAEYQAWWDGLSADDRANWGRNLAIFGGFL
jgi:hypothetical protein